MSEAQKSFVQLFGPRVELVKVGEFTVNTDGTVERNGEAVPFSRVGFMFEAFDEHGHTMIREKAELIDVRYKPWPAEVQAGSSAAAILAQMPDVLSELGPGASARMVAELGENLAGDPESVALVEPASPAPLAE